MRTSYMNEFAFKDIVFLTNRDLLKLLRHIENEILLLACHDDAPLIAQVASAFTEYGRCCFYEDLDSMGTVNSEDRIAAKKKIEEIFNKLLQDGKLQDWSSKYAS